MHDGCTEGARQKQRNAFPFQLLERVIKMRKKTERGLGRWGTLQARAIHGKKGPGTREVVRSEKSFEVGRKDERHAIYTGLVPCGDYAL